MGTVLEIELVSTRPAAARAQLAAAFAAVDALEAKLSRYADGSDVSRMNRGAGGPLLPVDPATAEVLGLSQRYARATDGVFDVTIGPLVELWVGAAREDRIPSEARITEARARVGAADIRIEGDRATLARPGMSIDLGAIGKGFALDRLAAGLREDGVSAALLNFGQSSTLAIGAPPGAPGWRLLLRAPGGAFAGTVRLRNQAFSVSSSFGRSSRIGGRRFGHVVDPRSGWPVEHEVQASVVATSGALAEALSTALVVLTPDEGVRVVEATPGAEARIESGDAAARETAGWRAATRFEPVESAARRNEIDAFAAARDSMVATQIEARGVADPRVRAALRAVPRHEFVDVALRARAYDDTPLPIGHGQTISQPYIVAFMSELAQLAPDARVLEVGTGCGYQAAVLRELAASVHTIEIVEPLAKEAEARLGRLGYGDVHVRHGDGYAGWPEAAPFDAIVVTAAAPHVPPALLEQLAPGGRLVIPVGEGVQELEVHVRQEDGFEVRRVLPVRFVPMTGRVLKEREER